MDSDHELVQQFLEIIEDSDLKYPLGQLIASFVRDAAVPSQALAYIHKICRPEPSSDFNHNLLEAAKDWSSIVEAIARDGVPPDPLSPAEKADIFRRDGGRCRITGKRGTLDDPLIIVPVVPIPENWIVEPPGFDHGTLATNTLVQTVKKRRFEMIGAFLTPELRDWWFKYIREPHSMSLLRNHWVVQKSAAAAFAKGLVKLDRRKNSPFEYHVCHVEIANPNPIHLESTIRTLNNHCLNTSSIGSSFRFLSPWWLERGLSMIDPRQIGTNVQFVRYNNQPRRIMPLVHPRIIATHARFSSSIRWLKVRQLLSKKKQPQLFGSRLRLNTGLPNGSRLSGLAKNIWLLVPNILRAAVYGVLWAIGRKIYGQTSSVQKLPFGLCLKYLKDSEILTNEFEALDLVRKHISIQAPDPIDLVLLSKGNTRQDTCGYILMTQLPGDPISRHIDMFSDHDISQLSLQLVEFVEQLRTLGERLSSETPRRLKISNITGGPIRNPRIQNGKPVGPFDNESAFSQLLSDPDSYAQCRHRIMLSHADLNSSNILVQEFNGTWQMSGIVGWGAAGYFPEYWEMSQAVPAMRSLGGGMERMAKALHSDYEEQMGLSGCETSVEDVALL